MMLFFSLVTNNILKATHCCVKSNFDVNFIVVHLVHYEIKLNQGNVGVEPV